MVPSWVVKRCHFWHAAAAVNTLTRTFPSSRIATRCNGQSGISGSFAGAGEIMSQLNPFNFAAGPRHVPNRLVFNGHRVVEDGNWCSCRSSARAEPGGT